LSIATSGRRVPSAPFASSRVARWATISSPSTTIRNGTRIGGISAFCPSDASVYAAAVRMPAMMIRPSSVEPPRDATGDVVLMAWA
jgi:hypothetical protein